MTVILSIVFFLGAGGSFIAWTIFLNNLWETSNEWIFPLIASGILALFASSLLSKYIAKWRHYLFIFSSYGLGLLFGFLILRVILFLEG